MKTAIINIKNRHTDIWYALQLFSSYFLIHLMKISIIISHKLKPDYSLYKLKQYILKQKEFGSKFYMRTCNS